MNKEFETYYLAKTWKRIFARIIDIIIVSLIPGLITLIWFLTDKSTSNQWWALMIMMVFSYLFFAFYFVFMPWKFNGQTLGKKIFFIKLVHQDNKKISLKNLLLRETFLVFVPMILVMIAILLANIFLDSSVTDIDTTTTLGFWISVLVRVIYSIMFAWFLGIMITVKADKKHQLFYDRKLQIYVINKNPLLKNPNPQEVKEKPHDFVHIHLGAKQPGNISQEGLDEIKDL